MYLLEGVPQVSRKDTVVCIYHYIIKQIWYKGYSVYHSNLKRGTL